VEGCGVGGHLFGGGGLGLLVDYFKSGKILEFRSIY